MVYLQLYILCGYNNLENILNSLEKEMHVVEVDEGIAKKAKQALDRMLAIK